VDISRDLELSKAFDSEDERKFDLGLKNSSKEKFIDP